MKSLKSFSARLVLWLRIMLTGRTHLVIFKAVKEAFETLKQKGTIPEEFKSTEGGLFREATEMLGLPGIYEKEKRYRS